MKLESGKPYTVKHSRKGRFALYVDHQDDTWITGTIIEGRASAMLDYNENVVGDEITVRKTHLLWAEEVTVNGFGSVS